MGIYKQEKQDFERLLNKIDVSEEFIPIWREEQTLWDVIFPLHPDKNEKDKSLKRMSDKFQIFQTDIFKKRSVSNAKSFLCLTWRFLNFSCVFKLTLKLH